MQQTQGRVEQVDQVRASAAGLRLVRAFFKVQARFYQLEIPVAELSPEKIIDAIGSLVEAVGGESIVYISRNAVEAGENPAVFEG